MPPSLPATLPAAAEWYSDRLGAARKLGPEHHDEALRWLGRHDLFFLLTVLLNRKDIARPWLFARCREVQADPNGHLDLWAREHYKSTIITFGLTVQDILNDPELTFGFFSHTRPNAKGFLNQIKREFEANEQLKGLYSDILWSNPAKEAPTWSLDDGIIVKRISNPKEATVEAWGVVEGQPIGKHFRRLVYDDVVTKESVTTPEMIAKTTESWALSLNLGSEGGAVRYIGTRYHFNDTYAEMMKRGSAAVRKYPATVDGTVAGDPVLLSAERIAEKRRDMGPYVFGCQMLQDPVADATQGFKRVWLRYQERPADGDGLNKYILVDPASAKKKGSDYTAGWVLGLGADRNVYVLDIVRDRLSLTERADMLFSLHRRWRPLGVGYEEYGLQADIEHMRDRMARQSYTFGITPLGGSMPKPDRIRRLVPYFEQGRILLPRTLQKKNYEGRLIDLVSTFVDEEYEAFPVGLHDDMLDSLARFLDEAFPVVWPMPAEPEEDRYARPVRRSGRGGSAWSA